MAKIAVIMGSSSDYEVMAKCVDILKKFGIEHEVRILSAHRTPDEVHAYAAGLEENGFDVVIAAAGKAAHLAGVIAGVATLPVIGVPMKTSLMGGMDSLLSVVQMPKGIPVATVAVDGAENAALLAIQMLGVKHAELRNRMKKYREIMKNDVLKKDAELTALLNEK